MHKKSGFLNIPLMTCIKKAFFLICLFWFSLNASALSFVVSAAAEASHILKAVPATLKSLVCYNTSASSQFIQVFNSATIPADGTAPNYTPMVCPATGNCTLDLTTIQGLPLSTGIVWTNSSTATTKTIGSATTFCTGAVQ